MIPPVLQQWKPKMADVLQMLEQQKLDSLTQILNKWNGDEESVSSDEEDDAPKRNQLVTKVRVQMHALLLCALGENTHPHR